MRVRGLLLGLLALAVAACGGDGGGSQVDGGGGDAGGVDAAEGGYLPLLVYSSTSTLWGFSLLPEGSPAQGDPALKRFELTAADVPAGFQPPGSQVLSLRETDGYAPTADVLFSLSVTDPRGKDPARIFEYVVRPEDAADLDDVFRRLEQADAVDETATRAGRYLPEGIELRALRIAPLQGLGERAYEVGWQAYFATAQQSVSFKMLLLSRGPYLAAFVRSGLGDVLPPGVDDLAIAGAIDRRLASAAATP